MYFNGICCYQEACSDNQPENREGSMKYVHLVSSIVFSVPLLLPENVLLIVTDVLCKKNLNILKPSISSFLDQHTFAKRFDTDKF